MAVGDYLSSKSENEYNLGLNKQKSREVIENIDDEIESLVKAYEKQGMSTKDAQSIAYMLAKYETSFIDQRITNGHGSDEIQDGPLKNAVVTFFSFFIFGMTPLLVYVLSMFVPVLNDHVFFVASVLTGVTLFLLGALKSLITQSNWLRSGLEMLIIGGLAAVSVYIGRDLKGPSHFIMRRLYLFICVRMLRHTLHGGARDWLGYIYMMEKHE